MGFAFTPSIVVLHHYFEKRFVVANGVAFAGISCGELIFPLILQPIINAYGWRGALFIMAAVELNLVVCGGVMVRPPQTPNFRIREKKTRLPNSTSYVKGNNTNSLDIIKETLEKATFNSISNSQIDDDVVSSAVSVESHALQYSRQESTSSESSSESSVSSESNASSTPEPRPQFLRQPRKSIALFMFGPPDEYLDDQRTISEIPSIQQNVGLTRTRRQGRDESDIFNSSRSTSRVETGRRTGRDEGGIWNRRRRQPRYSIIETGIEVIEEFKQQKFVIARPLQYPFFVVMLPIMLMHGIGWYAVIAHLIPFAVSFGYPDSQAFDLLSLIGIGSLLGCLTHGWFIDKNMISSEFAKIGSLALLTIITLAYPAAHYSYPALACLSIIYGVAAGVSLPLFFALIRQLVPPEDVNAGVSLVIIMEMLGDTIGGVSAGMYLYVTYFFIILLVLFNPSDPNQLSGFIFEVSPFQLFKYLSSHLSQYIRYVNSLFLRF